jgi:hypothetical protein
VKHQRIEAEGILCAARAQPLARALSPRFT